MPIAITAPTSAPANAAPTPRFRLLERDPSGGHHSLLTCLPARRHHSARNNSLGCNRAARRAGTSAASTAISAAAGIARQHRDRGKLVDGADAGPFGNGSPDEPPEEHAEREPDCTADDRERDRLPRHSRADIPAAEAERPEDTEVVPASAHADDDRVCDRNESEQHHETGQKLAAAAVPARASRSRPAATGAAGGAAVVTERTHPFVDGISRPVAHADREHFETVGEAELLDDIRVHDGTLGEGIAVVVRRYDGLSGHAERQLARRTRDADLVTELRPGTRHGVAAERDLVGRARLASLDDGGRDVAPHGPDREPQRRHAVHTQRDLRTKLRDRVDIGIREDVVAVLVVDPHRVPRPSVQRGRRDEMIQTRAERDDRDDAGCRRRDRARSPCGSRPRRCRNRARGAGRHSERHRGRRACSESSSAFRLCGARARRSTSQAAPTTTTTTPTNTRSAPPPSATDVELPPRTRFDAPTQSDRHPGRCEPGAGDAEQRRRWPPRARRRAEPRPTAARSRAPRARSNRRSPPDAAACADDRLTDRDGGRQRGNEAEQDKPDGEHPDRVFDRTHVLALEADFGACPATRPRPRH